MTTTCPVCSFTYRIAKSKRKNPCPSCAHKAKFGETLQEKARRKAKAAMERSRLKSLEKQRLNTKPKTPIQKFSEKGAKQARAVAKVKTEAKTAARDGGHIKCEGCHRFFKQIDYSHIIPLSKSAALASDIKNKRLFCRDCHDKWGNASVEEMITLKTFVEDMRYLFDNDPERFWKIHFRLVDEYLVRPTPKLERVLSKLEKFET